jgi:lipopolysaccharide export system ATP-binding protein
MTNLKKFRILSFKNENKILKLVNLSIKFEKKIILDNLSLDLNPGQIFGLLGPNGVGKSTIFNLIIGLIKPDLGKIIIENNDITNYPVYVRAKKFKIGFVPQNGGYFHGLNVYQNLKAIAEIYIEDKKYQEEKINTLIAKFELENVRDIKTSLLSGGQKKKLVISMALISNPKILLLDEPFAALDVMTIKMLQKIIIDLQTNSGISIILCDHQARDLLNCVDKAAIIYNGKVVAEGKPSNLVNNINAKNAYFGDSFNKI